MGALGGVWVIHAHLQPYPLLSWSVGRYPRSIWVTPSPSSVVKWDNSTIHEMHSFDSPMQEGHGSLHQLSKEVCEPSTNGTHS
jgi:hypothetical protein